jgi:mono/diheme cytochrome c family protein
MPSTAREHGPNRRRDIAFVLALLAAPLVAVAPGCSGAKGSAASGNGDVSTGKDLYAQMCASCHGKMAEGAIGPALSPWKGTEQTLADAIDGTMPQDNPAACDRTCAEDIAAYIVGLKQDCQGEQQPRRLRLLNRREYDATVKDLFFPASSPPAMGASCQSDADCDLASESCTGGTCVADPCNLRTFVLPANGQTHSSVAVAGSFNGWSPTAGAQWQMTYVPQKDVWALKHTLQNGSYQYKLVVDGNTWLTDPSNPNTQDDGYGGKNSLLTVSCSNGSSAGGSGAPANFDPAKDFPVETRPPGYPFDNSADAGLVTSVHVDQYMKAAAALADMALQNLPSVVPCDPSADAKACATQFAKDFGARAFRRPLADDEVAKYAGLVTAQGDFETGVSVAIQVMLSSPYFLYRFEVGAAQPDGTYQLTPYEIASALSYTFWGTMPDQALFDAAAQGDLGTAAGIEKQARRLLADARSRNVVEVFAMEWLGVEPILVAQKSAELYPTFDDQTRAALAEETRRFVSHVVFDGTRKYDELLTADYTFANGAVAGLYGLSGASGDSFAQVSLPPERRAGLLAQGSVLGSYAYADQSSPVRRGLFVRRNLLCEDFPKPPPNGGKVPPVDPNATTRDRFAQHSKDPACASCHQYIDGVGFGFEHFDAVGRWRDTDNGKPIDASGDMNDVEQLGSGTHAPFSGLPELASVLAGSHQSKACFARQIYRFTKGAVEAPEDRCAIDGVVARFAESGFDMQELMIAVATAPTFTVRR